MLSTISDDHPALLQARESIQSLTAIDEERLSELLSRLAQYHRSEFEDVDQPDDAPIDREKTIQQISDLEKASHR